MTIASIKPKPNDFSTQRIIEYRIPITKFMIFLSLDIATLWQHYPSRGDPVNELLPRLKLLLVTSCALTWRIDGDGLVPPDHLDIAQGGSMTVTPILIGLLRGKGVSRNPV